jgi:hypothetical protein
MSLIDVLRENFKQSGIIVYSWVLCELLNAEDAQELLTKSDKEVIGRLIKKIERQHSKNKY